MQVKKFEAKSVKQALEMVKKQLGPEAIILSVKDNKKQFGLIGETSVEITAVISDQVLQKKRQAEMKMTKEILEKFQNSSAKMQKKFIDVATEKNENNLKQIVMPSKVPYIDIKDEVKENKELKSTDHLKEKLDQRIQAAANTVIKEIQKKSESNSMDSLKKEIEGLKAIISEMKDTTSISSGGYFPGAEKGIPYELSFAFTLLKEAGVKDEISAHILSEGAKIIPHELVKKKNFVISWVAKFLLESIKISKNPMESKFHCFVGGSGQGKTLTSIKIASYLVMKMKKKIALVLSGTHSIGTREQYRIYSQILNVPLYFVMDQNQWKDLVDETDHIDHYIIDLPSISSLELDAIHNLKNLLPPYRNQRIIHYVVSLLNKDSDIHQLSLKFQKFGFDDVIFTFLDQTSQYGSIINFIHNFDVPIHSFGKGNRVPDDFEWATKERVIDLIFKFSNGNYVDQEVR